MPPRLLRNAGFQCAFHGVAREIVRAVIQARVEERFGLPDSNPAKRLEVSPVHALMLSDGRRNSQRWGHRLFLHPPVSQTADSDIDNAVGFAVARQFHFQVIVG